MRTLPETMIRVLNPFAPLFSRRVWQHVLVLLVGAILAPGKRTVASALQALGLHDERRFCRYHRVLSVDETLERRRGKKIAAKGIYRDPVRSSHTHFVKTSALRWVCVALLVRIPWASRVWALPFLSALAYSERYAKEQGK